MATSDRRTNASGSPAPTRAWSALSSTQAMCLATVMPTGWLALAKGTPQSVARLPTGLAYQEWFHPSHRPIVGYARVALRQGGSRFDPMPDGSIAHPDVVGSLVLARLLAPHPMKPGGTLLLPTAAAYDAWERHLREGGRGGGGRALAGDWPRPVLPPSQIPTPSGWTPAVPPPFDRPASLTRALPSRAIEGAAPETVRLADEMAYALGMAEGEPDTARLADLAREAVASGEADAALAVAGRALDAARAVKLSAALRDAASTTLDGDGRERRLCWVAMRDGLTAEATLKTVLAEQRGHLAFAMALGFGPGQASSMVATVLPAMDTEVANAMPMAGLWTLGGSAAQAEADRGPPPDGWAVLPILVTGDAPRGFYRGDAAAPAGDPGAGKLQQAAAEKIGTVTVDGEAPFAGPPRRDLEEALLDVALDLVGDHRSYPDAPDLDRVPRLLTRLRWDAEAGHVEVFDCIHVPEGHGHDLEPGLAAFPMRPAVIPAHLVAARWAEFTASLRSGAKHLHMPGPRPAFATPIPEPEPEPELEEAMELLAEFELDWEAQPSGGGRRVTPKRKRGTRRGRRPGLRRRRRRVLRLG